MLWNYTTVLLSFVYPKFLVVTITSQIFTLPSLNKNICCCFYFFYPWIRSNEKKGFRRIENKKNPISYTFWWNPFFLQTLLLEKKRLLNVMDFKQQKDPNIRRAMRWSAFKWIGYVRCTWIDWWTCGERHKQLFL